MFRTRDFILFFTAIVFLVTAIGVTSFKKSISPSSPAQVQQFVDDEEKDYVAVVNEDSGLSREERLKAMKEKISKDSSLKLTNSPEVDEEENVSSEDEEVVAISGLQKCSGYRPFQGEWSFSKLEFDVVEGSRIVFEEVLSESSVRASGTAVVEQEVKRDVYLQLPIRSGPVANTSCIATDVIGVAQDGSLIRNTEAKLYGVFGPDTLVGYALDGFPIYGVSDVQTDNCGGVSIAGQYQYFLNNSRETVLNCFSAPPVSI
ncbi:hypothetical protein KC926_01265 [Candidatus Kaiserbacteria bacterium]|nr:hypothetical protein [Candidatus Kaiserbacteria bacterium]